MPGLEGRAFYPLFPTSFAKYFQMLSNIHSARMYAAQALFANELWDGEDKDSPLYCFSLHESSLKSIREREFAFRQFFLLPIRRGSDNQD